MLQHTKHIQDDLRKTLLISQERKFGFEHTDTLRVGYHLSTQQGK